MWKIIIGFFLLSTIINLKAQDKIQAILLRVEGEGMVIRDGNTYQLKIPFNFYADDAVHVKKGGFTLLHTDGNELLIKEGEVFTFNKNDEVNEGKISENLSETMHQFYVMRNVEHVNAGEVNVLPDNFKCIQGSHIYLYWANIPTHNPVYVTVTEKNTGDTIIIERITKGEKYVIKEDLPPGTYNWMLDVENEILIKSGSFNVTENTGPCAELKVTDEWSRLNLIACLMDAGYLYDALSYVEYGIEETGKNNIYIYLKDQLLRQMQQ